MKQLPNWCLTNRKPGFYDTESATAVEQTAKLYRSMQELIDECNTFTEQLQLELDTFTAATDKNYEEFEANINKIMHDYIAMIDIKVAKQDQIIEENITYIRENINDGVTQIIGEMKESGELDEIIGDTLDGIETRVNTLENTEYTLDLEEGTENLILVKIVKEGE